LENKINKLFVSLKTRAKQERAITWWSPIAQTSPVLDSSSFVPVSTLKHQKPLHSYVQERKYTVSVQCSVQYTLLLLYLMLVMSYCA
jgi:hypothetical protein